MDPNWKPSPPKKSSTEEAAHLPLSYIPIDQNISDSVRTLLAAETEKTAPSEFRPEPYLLPNLCKCGEKWKSFDELYTQGTYFAATFKKSLPVYV